jgi:ABC-type polysaccharide/polyol phosphate transport system ATPase subunit
VNHLPPDVALAVEALGRRQTDIHQRRYRRAVSIGARLRGQRDGIPAGYADELMEEDDEEEFEEDDEPVLAVEDADWALQDVSFSVAPGEALGLVGDRGTIANLIRILVGTTAPTSGRFLYRGRLGMSTEMAMTLARREIVVDTGIGLRALALLAGVPRLRRKAWMREVKSMMVDPDGRPLPSGNKTFATNLCISASLDPTADVLFIDYLPSRKLNDGLLERCKERIGRRLAEGAAAIICVPDTKVIEQFCARAVRLEKGQVAAAGSAPEIIAAMNEDQPRRAKRLKSFNADGAIVSAELVDWNDRPTRELLHGGPFRALARFETAWPDTEVRWRVTALGTDSLWFAEPVWRTIAEPGTFNVALELAAAEWDGDEYELSVDATVRVEGRMATIRRALPGRFTVVAPPGAERAAGAVDSPPLTSAWAPADAGETLVGP